MQPSQVEDRHEVWCRQQEHELERAAWMVSNLMAAWVQDPPSVDDLLGRTVRK